MVCGVADDGVENIRGLSVGLEGGIGWGPTITGGFQASDIQLTTGDAAICGGAGAFIAVAGCYTEVNCAREDD